MQDIKANWLCRTNPVIRTNPRFSDIEQPNAPRHSMFKGDTTTGLARKLTRKEKQEKHNSRSNRRAQTKEELCRSKREPEEDLSKEHPHGAWFYQPKQNKQRWTIQQTSSNYKADNIIKWRRVFNIWKHHTITEKIKPEENTFNWVNT